MLGQALAGQDLGLHFFAFEVRFRFIAQFVDTFFAGTGYSLIGADDDAFDRRQVVNRLECHEHDDRRAVRVGNDALVPGNIFRVDFRYDQGDIRVHTERAGVVDDDAAPFSSFGSQFLTDRAAGEQADINTVERFWFGFFNRIFLAVDGQFLASRTVRC